MQQEAVSGDGAFERTRQETAGPSGVINETKEALRLLLCDMQSTMAAIVESQREVEEAKKELSAVVVEPGPPAPGPVDMEIDELLGHIGVELTADQQAALKEKIAECKKRKLGPPLPCRRATVT